MARAAAVTLLILVATGPAAAEPPAPSNVREQIAQGDRVFRHRTGEQDFWTSIYWYEQALKADPQSAAALWRLARAYTGLGGATAQARRRDFGTKGLGYAEQAIKLAPNRVEGWYYAATSLGLYASGIGALRALREGIQQRFLKFIKGAMARDPNYDYAAPLMVYGRYFYELPWPMRDLDQSLRYLQDAHRRAPTRIRNVCYLAETLLAQGERAAALRELETCAAMDPAKEDPYDGRLAVRECRKLLAKERK
jgi:tetratricopeptide (TPR) repeat protein